MRGRTLSLSGKTLLAPNIPNNAGFRESKLGSTMPISSKPMNSTTISPRITKPLKIKDLQSISTSDITMASKDNMIRIRKLLEKLYKNFKEITLYNHARVFNETNILEAFNTLLDSYRNLYHDAVFYYKSIKAIEEASPSNRVVSNAQLKSSALSFHKQWEDVVLKANSIRENGVSSLNDFITLKFNTIKQLLTHVASYTKNPSYKEQIEKSTIKFQESMLALSKSVTLTLTQRDAVNDQPSLMETPIKDVRTFNSLFNEACYNIYSRCGIQQSDLKQLKQDIITASNEIVISIRAGFSFDKDMNMIDNQVTQITEFVDQLMELVELPPSPVRSPVMTSRKTRANGSSREGVTMPNTEYNGVVDMVEKFVSDIKKDFKLEIDDTTDVFEKLEEIRSQLLISYKPEEDSYSPEVKFSTLDIAIGENQQIYTDFDEQNTQTTARSRGSSTSRSRRPSTPGDSPVKPAEYEARIAALEEEIKKRDDEIKAIKQYKDDQAKQTIEKAINRMSGIMTDSDGEFVKEGEKAEKLSLFVVDRKCPICAKRELEELEIVDKAREAFSKMEKDVTDLTALPQAIEDLVQQCEEAQNEVELRNEELDIKNSTIFNLSQKCDEQSDKLTAMELATNSFIQVVYGDNKPEGHENMDLATLTMNAFTDMDKKHKLELKQQEINIEERHKEMWKDVYERLKISPDDGPSGIYKEFDKQQAATEELRTQLNLANNTLKRIEAWMRDHVACKTEGMSIDEKFQALMFAIDEAPNPLSIPYEELMKERRAVRADIEETVTNLAKVFHVKLGVKSLKTIKINKLMELHKNLTGKASGDMSAKNEKIAKQGQTIERLRGVIVKQCARLWEFLEVQVQSLEGQNIEEMMSKLSDLIDEVCSSGSQNFVSKEVINKAVIPIRKYINTKSNDPRVFIPDMVRMISESFETFAKIYTIAKPLQEALDTYDFTKMPTVGDPKFSHTRDCVFQVTTIIKEAQEEFANKEGAKSFDVLNISISLTCALFSLLAAQSFGTPGATGIA